MTTDNPGTPAAPEGTPPATPPPAPTPAPEGTPPATGDDLAAELAKWKEQARKNEAKAKANAQAATELAQLKASQMSDTDRAVQTARDEATTEARKTFGSRLVAAEVRVAAAGRSVDVDTLLEGIDASKFLDDAGEPDAPAIKAWVDKVAPAAPDTKPSFPDLGQGARPGAVSGGPAQDLATFISRQLNAT